MCLTTYIAMDMESIDWLETQQPKSNYKRIERKKNLMVIENIL
jgi:hypothetical protein